MLAYFCIVLSAAIGYFSGPWWLSLLPGLVLAIFGIAEQQRLRPRFAAVQATEVLMISGAASLLNGLLTAGASYIMGRAVGWLFPI